jgi:hypothetical protein
MAASAAGQALGELFLDASLGSAQLDHPRKVTGLGAVIPVVRVDGTDVAIATVDATRALPLIDDPLQAAARTLEIERRAEAFSPLALPLERLRTVRRISPALVIPHGGGSPALEGLSPLGLRDRFLRDR